MLLAILLTIYCIMFILALIYIVGCLVAKHELSTRKKYQEHIDNLVDELFPPDTVKHLSSLQLSMTIPQRQEAKRDMVANIRTYFNQRKILHTPPSVQRILE